MYADAVPPSAWAQKGARPVSVAGTAVSAEMQAGDVGSRAPYSRHRSRTTEVVTACPTAPHWLQEGTGGR